MEEYMSLTKSSTGQYSLTYDKYFMMLQNACIRCDKTLKHKPSPTSRAVYQHEIDDDDPCMHDEEDDYLDEGFAPDDMLKNSSSLSSRSPALRGLSALLTLLVSFLKIACLHVSFTAYENFYKLSKMHCLLVLTFHFPIFRMSECRNPTIKHIFTYTLISPFIRTYVTDLFLVIFFT